MRRECRGKEEQRDFSRVGRQEAGRELILRLGGAMRIPREEREGAIQKRARTKRVFQARREVLWRLEAKGRVIAHEYHVRVSRSNIDEQNDLAKTICVLEAVEVDIRCVQATLV